jgi:hypothetical protein
LKQWLPVSQRAHSQLQAGGSFLSFLGFSILKPIENLRLPKEVERIITAMSITHAILSEWSFAA